MALGVSAFLLLVSLASAEPTSEHIDQPDGWTSYLCTNSDQKQDWVTDEWLAKELDESIPNEAHIMMMMGQCYSGGFIDELKQRKNRTGIPKLSISTSARWFETAWGWKPSVPPAGKPAYDGYAPYWTDAVGDKTTATMKQAYHSATADVDQFHKRADAPLPDEPQYWNSDDTEGGYTLFGNPPPDKGDKNKRWAILFVGYEATNPRYDETMKSMYDDLKDKYGYEPDHIRKLSGGSKADLEAGIKEFGDKDHMGKGDGHSLLIWTYDHGSIDGGKVFMSVSRGAGGSAAGGNVTAVHADIKDGKRVVQNNQSHIYWAGNEGNKRHITGRYQENGKPEPAWAESLNTLDSADIDALSGGRDPIGRSLFFSLADHSGTAGPVEGDIFSTKCNKHKELKHQEAWLGLVGDDNLDALEYDDDGHNVYGYPDPADNKKTLRNIYFSTREPTVKGKTSSILNGYYDGTKWDVRQWAEPSEMGLNDVDNLDALALWDVTAPRTLNPGHDKALFSLATLSPSLENQWDTVCWWDNKNRLAKLDLPGRTEKQFSGADIFWTDFKKGKDGKYHFYLFANAERLGLTYEDDVDALDTPELSSCVLLLVGLPIAAYVRRRKKQ